MAVTRRTSSSSTRNTPSFRDTEGSSITVPHTSSSSSVPVTTQLSKQRARAAECEGKTCPCFVAGDRRLQVLAGGQVAGSSSHLRLLVTSCPHRPLLGRPLLVVTII